MAARVVAATAVAEMEEAKLMKAIMQETDRLSQPAACAWCEATVEASALSEFNTPSGDLVQLCVACSDGLLRHIHHWESLAGKVGVDASVVSPESMAKAKVRASAASCFLCRAYSNPRSAEELLGVCWFCRRGR